MYRILHVEDDASWRRALRRALPEPEFAVTAHATLADGMRALREERHDAALVDLRLTVGSDDRSGLDIVRYARATDGPLTWVMTACSDEHLAVICRGAGAVGLFEKGAPMKALITDLRNVLAARPRARSVPPIDDELALLTGRSATMERLRRDIALVACGDDPVLVTGETGVGKNVVVAAIHARSRRSGPLEVVNVGGHSEQFFESTLFGHERGAFTGALKARAGAFETAAGGTLLLDEIGDLPLALQPRLLRAVQERRIRRIGGETERPVSARVIAATHRDLQVAAESGTFRRDLLHRLAILHVHVPPLRDRREDIPELAATHAAKRGVTLAEPVLDWLAARAYPGNVRELFALVAQLGAVDTRVTLDTVRDRFGGEAPLVDAAATPHQPRVRLRNDAGLEDAVLRLRREVAEAFLAKANGNVSAAAAHLGVHRNTLARWARGEPRPRSNAANASGPKEDESSPP